MATLTLQVIVGITLTFLAGRISGQAEFKIQPNLAISKQQITVELKNAISLMTDRVQSSLIETQNVLQENMKQMKDQFTSAQLKFSDIQPGQKFSNASFYFSKERINSIIDRLKPAITHIIAEAIDKKLNYTSVNNVDILSAINTINGKYDKLYEKLIVYTKSQISKLQSNLFSFNVTYDRNATDRDTKSLKKETGVVKQMAGIIKTVKAIFGDVEMAPYEVVAEHENYEERVYPSKKWVGTKMEGPEYKPCASPMFRKLFNYISGKNKPNMRIDMTTPVSTLIQPGAGPTCASNFTMNFFVPEEHQSDPPDPGEKDVFIVERPVMHVLTRRFGGYTTDDIIANEAAALATAIQENKEEGVDFTQYYLAGYDPPFKPINRRNEIWYVKTVPDKPIENLQQEDIGNGVKVPE